MPMFEDDDQQMRYEAWLAYWELRCVTLTPEQRAEFADALRAGRSGHDPNRYLRAIMSDREPYSDFLSRWESRVINVLQQDENFRTETQEGTEREMNDMIAEGAPPDETERCFYCDEELEEGVVTDDGDACSECADICRGCGGGFLMHDLQYCDASWSRGYYCEGCREECQSCGDILPRSEAYSIGYEGYACRDCARDCEECGEYHVDGEDEPCPHCGHRPSDGTIDGYRHTHPDRWYGGPVPRDEKGRHLGYYVGIELEISSDVMSARPIIDWLIRNRLDGLMEFKEDSSVEGFEIVTQPMTPAFFESVDWDGFFKMLNKEYPVYGNEEPEEHGMHVHIGRVAFQRDDVSLAAWAYLIGQGDHLERLGRREPTHYCAKVPYPASAAIVSAKPYRSVQALRLAQRGAGRDAINFNNGSTVEVRAFKSTRSAAEFRDCVRMVYLTADYIRDLRPNKYATLPKNALHWDQFTQWVKVNAPEAYPAMADLPRPSTNKKKNANKAMAFSYDS